MADNVILDKIEEIKSLAHEAQKTIEEVKAGKADNEKFVKMETDFGKISEEIQELKMKAESEEKSRQELELAFSKVNEHGAAETLSSPEYVKGFEKYLRSKKEIDAEFVKEEVKSLILASNPYLSEEEVRTVEAKAMLAGSNPDGGFLVPLQQNAALVKRLFETSPMRTIADVMNASSEAMQFILDDDQADAGWVGETDTRSETDSPQLGSVEIPIHEIYAMPTATQKMLDDGMINVENWLIQKIADKFARTENTAFVTGNGVKQPTGINTYAAWTTAGTYERNKLETYTSTGTATNLDEGDDFITLQSLLLAGYKGTWVMNRKTWAAVLKLQDSQGNYLLNPAMLFSGAQGMQLLGDPVVIFNDMPDIANNSLSVAYGDFSQAYKVLDRIGIRVLRDPYTTKGYVKFYATKRVGGGVVNFQAIKRLKTKSS